MDVKSSFTAPVATVCSRAQVRARVQALQLLRFAALAVLHRASQSA
jgi:hypothetical protein